VQGAARGDIEILGCPDRPSLLMAESHRSTRSLAKAPLLVGWTKDYVGGNVNHASKWRGAFVLAADGWSLL
jgi:hypothetical protein